MTRGMEAACYVKLANGATVADLRKTLEVRGGRCRCDDMGCAAAGCYAVLCCWCDGDVAVLLLMFFGRRAAADAAPSGGPSCGSPH